MGDETTEKLYYNDSPVLRFDAKIIECVAVNGKGALVLNRTAFYPEGGGQPGDVGTINDVEVYDTTMDQEGRILHWLAELEPFHEGMAVTGQVDVERRLDHTQQHSGQHLLSKAFESLFGWQTVGFHLGSESVTIDLSIDSLEWSHLARAERRANQAVFEDLPRRIDVYHNASDIPAELRGSHAPEAGDLESTEGFRVVSFGSFDSVPCGGTHVERTGQVGLIKILGTERIRTDTRVHFVAGWRSLRRFENFRSVLSGLTERLTTGIGELNDAVDKLLENNRSRERALRDLQTTVYEYRAEELLRTADTLPSGERLVVSVEEGDMQSLQFLATQAGQHPPCIALLAGVAGDTAQFVFSCAEVPAVNCAHALRHAFEPFGGRGGGNASRAQGGGIAAGDAGAVLEAARRVILDQLNH